MLSFIGAMVLALLIWALFGTRLVVLILLVWMLCTSMTGCALVPHYTGAEWEHVSHPLAGPPFGPMSEEDSLDHIVGYAGWKKGRAYTEVNLGYRFVDGGFYGPDLTGGIRVGVVITGERR